MTQVGHAANRSPATPGPGMTAPPVSTCAKHPRVLMSIEFDTMVAPRPVARRVSPNSHTTRPSPSGAA